MAKKIKEMEKFDHNVANKEFVKIKEKYPNAWAKIQKMREILINIQNTLGDM